MKRISGRGAPLFQSDVDTDAILPKQFLRKSDKSGFGECLFFEWKKKPEFVLNQPRFAGAKVLIAGENFGCGSSREHAVWAITGGGFDAVVAPSFGDIFANNSGKNGLVLVRLPAEMCRDLAERVSADPALEISIDVERQELVVGDLRASFQLPPQVRRLLLEGLDEIGLTLKHDAEMTAYEQHRPSWMPSLPTARVGAR